MKAMILRQFKPAERNPLEFADTPLPQLRPEEILVKVKVCGVCHTDLHTIEGELPGVKLPVIPGHQAVGIVERGGEHAGRFKKGERVGVAWLHSACGKCSFCLSGRENLCQSSRFTGYHVDGGYAEYLTVPHKFAYALPHVFSDEEAAPFLCAGIIGYRALRLSGIKPGECLGLYGFGASAHIAIQIAQYWGCRVYVFSRGKEHQDLAENWAPLGQDQQKKHPPQK